MYTEQMARQFGAFIGEFVEYDAKAVAAGLRTFMRVRVLVDIRQPLKRKKKLILAKQKEIFAMFKYERLTTFCFISGRLGHGESFCPVRLVKGSQELPMGWDLSIKAPVKKTLTGGSIWLREPGGIWGVNGWELGCDQGVNNLQANFANFMRFAGSSLGLNLTGKSNLSKLDEVGPIGSDMKILNEASLILIMDGKKRPRVHSDENYNYF